MQIVQVINNAHEDSVVAIAYDSQRKEIYTASEGDRLIKVLVSRLHQLCTVACFTVNAHRCGTRKPASSCGPS
jgi:hypothetical protein